MTSCTLARPARRGRVVTLRTIAPYRSTWNPATTLVILEGNAIEVKESDEPTLTKLDSASKQKYRMPLTTIPGKTVIYAVQPLFVLAWTEQNFPNNATRWEFEQKQSA